MAVTLTLRHLWTRTGSPREWTFEDPDERELRDFLKQLQNHAAPLDSRRAVLIASAGDDLIGSWDRAGCDVLASMIEVEPHDDQWLDLRHALRDAVSGP